MFECEYCGCTLPHYEEFCPGCGSKIDIIKNKIPGSSMQYENEVKQENTAPVSAYEVKDKNAKMKNILAGIIIAALFIIIFGISMSNSQSPDIETISSKEDETKTIYDYQEELTKDPANIKAYQGLIGEYLKAGAIDAASVEIDKLIKIRHDDPVLYKEIGADLIKYNYKAQAMSILNIGYAYTKDESLKEIKQNIKPEEVLTSGAFKQALELIYQKPISGVNWEDIKKIKYVDLSANTLKYSFEDRDTYKDQFEDTISEVTTEEDFRKSVDIVLFEELAELHTSPYNTLYINDIAGLPKLKKLYVANIYGSNDLKPFALFDNLEILWVGGDDLNSLEGITELKSVKEIGFQDTALTNLSMLSALENITAVHLGNNSELQSLATIGNMKHLKKLSIEGDEIKDLSFLKGLNNLESLSIIDTIIKSTDFLKGMPHLKYLKFESNDEVKDISAIAMNTKLEELYLDCYDLAGLSSLKNLTNMKKLTLTRVPDLGIISKFSNLKQLTLISCGGVNNLKPLSYLTHLEKLSLTDNGDNIGNLKPLASLKMLKHLDLSKNDLYDNVSPIFTLDHLEYLNLGNCHINNGLSGIQKMSMLKELNLNSTKLIANTSIQSDGFITSIDYDDIAMDQHTKYLAGLSQLEVLRINKTEMKDIGFLKNLKSLKTIDLSDNYIIDISALSALNNIQYIDVRNNAIADLTPLEKYTNAVVLGK